MLWDDLRIFLAVARQGSLGAAARSLGQSQPTMGRRLRALEDALGHTLFQRTADGFVLTDEGSGIMENAERVEEETLAIQRRLLGANGRSGGSLRLTSSDWFGRRLLAPVIAEYSRQHPEICVELLTDARIYSLPRREADLAFRITPFEEPEIISRRLTTIEYRVYGREGSQTPTIGDGTGVRLVGMDAAFAGMPDAKWLRGVLPNASLTLCSNSRDVQAALCLEGAGLAILPVPLATGLAGLIEVDIGEHPPSRDTFVGYHRDLRRLARLRDFLDLTISRLAGTNGSGQS